MAPPAPDLILTNARVITLDPRRPSGKTVLIGGGRILSVNNEDRQREKGAKTIDCGGRTVLPGFIDAHGHLAAYAQSLVTLDLEPRGGIPSLDDIQKAIRRLSTTLPPGAWIRGRGYDEFYLREKRHPTRHDLDQAVSTHPVKISHRSGQAHVLNSRALSLVGISSATPDPPDGLIDRDVPTGEPTGLLYGMGGFLSAKVPPLAGDEYAKGIRMANENLLAAGITSLQDASAANGREAWRMFEGWKKEGLLLPHIRMMLGYEGFQDCERNGGLVSSLPEAELSCGGVKIMISETTGSLLPEQAVLNEMVLTIHRQGCQAVLHAVEEKQIEAACLAIEYAVKKHSRADHRHRIEHCSVCPPALAKRLAAAGIVVVTQPGFIYYHGERYRKTVPSAQFDCLYPLATLLDAGVLLAGSSDFPVAPPTPLTGMYAAVSRQAETGEIILRKEAIEAEKALRLYTENGAWSAFEEKEKGSLTPGKLADLVVVNGDPLSPEAEEIKKVSVALTIISGKVVWESDGMFPRRDC